MTFDKDKKYPLFISHCWDYRKDYETVEKWIKESDITWKNMSIPVHNPKDASSDRELATKIDNNIRQSSVFIVIAGMYAAQKNRPWINFEIDSALQYNKKILAIKPRGNERLPTKISEKANKIVNWNSSSVIDGIKELL